jgi:hypothetical protein
MNSQSGLSGLENGFGDGSGTSAELKGEHVCLMKVRLKEIEAGAG